MDSSSVYENVRHGALLAPTNERQARPLTKLSSPEAQQEAWKTVVETAPEGLMVGTKKPPGWKMALIMSWIPINIASFYRRLTLPVEINGILFVIFLT